MTNEFPKMLTAKLKGKTVPVHYPPGHDKHGQHVIANNAAEEKALVSVGVAHHGRPEMHSQLSPNYTYDAWNPWNRI